MCHFDAFKDILAVLWGRSKGRVQGVCNPPPPPSLDNLQLSNTTDILPKKKNVIYWCWSKTWDKVKEFMLNIVKMVVWH